MSEPKSVAMENSKTNLRKKGLTGKIKNTKLNQMAMVQTINIYGVVTMEELNAFAVNQMDQMMKIINENNYKQIKFNHSI